MSDDARPAAPVTPAPPAGSVGPAGTVIVPVAVESAAGVPETAPAGSHAASAPPLAPLAPLAGSGPAIPPTMVHDVSDFDGAAPPEAPAPVAQAALVRMAAQTLPSSIGTALANPGGLGAPPAPPPPDDAPPDTAPPSTERGAGGPAAAHAAQVAQAAQALAVLPPRSPPERRPRSRWSLIAVGVAATLVIGTGAVLLALHFRDASDEDDAPAASLPVPKPTVVQADPPPAAPSSSSPAADGTSEPAVAPRHPRRPRNGPRTGPRNGPRQPQP